MCLPKRCKAWANPFPELCLGGIGGDVLTLGGGPLSWQ